MKTAEELAKEAIQEIRERMDGHEDCYSQCDRAGCEDVRVLLAAIDAAKEEATRAEREKVRKVLWDLINACDRLMGDSDGFTETPELRAMQNASKYLNTLPTNHPGVETNEDC